MRLIIKGALYLNDSGDVVVKSLSPTGEYDQIEAEAYVSKELAEDGEYKVYWDKFVEVDGEDYYFEEAIIAIIKKHAEELEKLAEKYGKKTQMYLDELEDAEDIVAVLEHQRSGEKGIPAAEAFERIRKEREKLKL